MKGAKNQTRQVLLIRAKNIVSLEMARIACGEDIISGTNNLGGSGHVPRIFSRIISKGAMLEPMLKLDLCWLADDDCVVIACFTTTRSTAPKDILWRHIPEENFVPKVLVIEIVTRLAKAVLVSVLIDIDERCALRVVAALHTCLYGTIEASDEFVDLPSHGGVA